MGETFKVGEIAVIQHCQNFAEYEGVECEITDGLEPRMCWRGIKCDLALVNVYCVLAADGKEFVLEPYQLRKRRPPQDWLKLCNLTDIPREVSHV